MTDATWIALFVFAVAFLGSFCAVSLDRWLAERARWRWPKRHKWPKEGRYD